MSTGSMCPRQDEERFVYFALSAEDRNRQGELRELLTDRIPDAELRRLMADPVDDDPGTFLEILQMPIGSGVVARGSVLEVLGERLYTGAYLSSVVIASFVLSALDEEDLLADAQSGRQRFSVADKDDTGTPTAQGVEVSASGRATGSRSFVLDGMSADTFIVAATRSGQACLVEIAATAPGVTRVPLPGLDQTRKLARIELADVASSLLWSDGPEQPVGASVVFAQVRRVTQAAVAAEQVGSAQQSLSIGLEYARGRKQFGREIGSYQAIKHRFAELALLVEQSRSAAYYALSTFGAADEDLQKAVSLARIICTRAAIETSEWCMQVQGGQGFRWDNPAHLYLKRAKSTQLLFGDPARERERIAGLLALT
jgi:alkylation response protein AidB-like acyl-CoA dehydrogenase